MIEFSHEEIEDARAEAMMEAQEEYEDQPRLYDYEQADAMLKAREQ